MPERRAAPLAWLTAATAARMLDALAACGRSVEVSLDLGIGRQEVELGDGVAAIAGITISAAELERVCGRENVVWGLFPGGLEALEERADGYCKLVPTELAPTVEISGVRMHRTKGIDPYEDSRTKAAAVVAAGYEVLDTCGGLGYTAIWARRLGAVRVVSIEIDPAVRRLRALNPWSQPFLHDEGIEKLEGDSEQFISGFEAGSFDAVLHDPPRFSLAGRLYGADFCRELCRMLRPGGRLMFYTGEPYRSGRGRDFVGGVGRRLSEAGFKARWRRPLQAFVCRK